MKTTKMNASQPAIQTARLADLRKQREAIRRELKTHEPTRGWQYYEDKRLLLGLVVEDIHRLERAELGLHEPNGPDWCNRAGDTVFAAVELSHAAHALLTTFALANGHGSVGAYLLSLARGDAGAMCDALASQQDRMADLFAIKGKETA